MFSIRDHLIINEIVIIMNDDFESNQWESLCRGIFLQLLNPFTAKKFEHSSEEENEHNHQKSEKKIALGPTKKEKE